MILLYFICAVLAMSVFAFTFRLSHRRRIVIAVLVFAILSGAITIYIYVVDDRPSPGDTPYNPSK
jgi:hypothetical protein